MNRRTLVIGVVVVIALGVGAAIQQGFWSPQGAIAQAPPARGPAQRVVPVETGLAVKKAVPVRVDLLGTKCVLNLIAGNRLVFTHPNPRLKSVPLTALRKFVGQTLQTTALREETAENCYQRILLRQIGRFFH